MERKFRLLIPALFAVAGLLLSGCGPKEANAGADPTLPSGRPVPEPASGAELKSQAASTFNVNGVPFTREKTIIEGRASLCWEWPWKEGLEEIRVQYGSEGNGNANEQSGNDSNAEGQDLAQRIKSVVMDVITEEQRVGGSLSKDRRRST